MKKNLLTVVLLAYCAINFGQVTLTQNLTTAGTLKTTLSSTQLSTTNRLIITGKINAQDFLTMRADMPLLDTLDISACSIVAYTGTAGTDGTTSSTYPANTIPQQAFGKTSKQSLKVVLLPTSATSIGDYAFYGCSNLNTVTFGSSITSIGMLAFANCNKLVGIDLNTNSCTIGNSAFESCLSLTSAKLGNVSTIAARAFSSCMLLSTVDLGNSLTSIGNQAFQSCSKLAAVNLPTTLTTIGDMAFVDCNSITSITIPQSTTSIGISAFYNMSQLNTFSVAPSNSAYSVQDNILMNKNRTTIIQCPTQKAGSYTIPNTVTTIDAGAFYNCSLLTQIVISRNVTTINSKAFGACTALKSLIVLPTTPPTLNGGDCFVGSTITSVNTNSSSLAAYLAILEWKNTKITSFPKITVKLDTPGTLGVSILLNYNGIKLSSISSLVVTGVMNDNDFNEIKNNMPMLSELDISGVTLASGTFPAGQFSNHPYITDVFLPSKLKKLPSNTFKNCNSLKSFSPFPTDTIGDYAFENCTNLANNGLALPTNIRYIGKNAFKNCSNIAGGISLPDSIMTINDSTFYGCSKIKGVVSFPLKTTKISKSAFEGCLLIDSIKINQNISTIEDYAFKGCTKINRIIVYKATPPSITTTSFTGIDNLNTLVFVPNGSKTTYENDANWKSFKYYWERALLNDRIVRINIGSEGTITINGINYVDGTKLTVLKDVAQTMTIIPKTGYEIEKAIIEGIDYASYFKQGEGTGVDKGKFTYTRMINSNSDITVTFVKIKHAFTIKTGNANITQLFETGETPTFTIMTSGPKISSIYFNGTDVTYKVNSQNQLTVGPITGISTLIVSFDATPVKTISMDQEKVYTIGKEVIIDGVESGAYVRLYNVNGILLQDIISIGEQITIPLESTGAYVVKTSKGSYKVVL
jgi:hypothetical protein